MRRMLFLFLILVSCKSTQPVSHTYTHTDSVITRERLVPIKIESTSVDKHFSASQVDSIIAALKSLPVGSRTIYYTDPKLKTTLSFALDSLGKLVIQCKTLEAMYWEKLKEKDHIIQTKDFELREQRKGFLQRIGDVFNHGIWFMVLLVVLYTAINWLIHRRRL